jgi:subtilase family serine protease
VQNVGVATAAASTTQYYLSLDAFRNMGDKRLNGSRSVPSLAPGATSTGSVTVTVPGNTAFGTYYLLACADDAKKVKEGNETNNCLASSATVAVGQ